MHIRTPIPLCVISEKAVKPPHIATRYAGVELLRVESPKTRASKSARHLCRCGIYEGLPIAFQRKCYILYRKCTLATKYNIRLVGSIILLTRSLRRYAPWFWIGSLRFGAPPSPKTSTTLRMTHGGGAVRTYEKNAVCDGYTSSYSLRLFPSPQGEGCQHPYLKQNNFLSG